MTTGDLLRAVIVRWYVTLAGLVLTAVGVVAVHSAPEVYETQVDVHFLTRPGFVRDATNNPDNDLVAVAGLVEREVRADDRLEPAAADVPLAGLGVTDGSMIVLPNEDGQFDFTFRQPVLRVKAVGTTAEEAGAWRDERVAEIRGVLDRLQSEDGIEARERIRTRLVPAVPPVGTVSNSPDRAAAVSGILGLGLTGLAAVILDRLMLRHRPRRRDEAGSGRATTS